MPLVRKRRAEASASPPTRRRRSASAASSDDDDAALTEDHGDEQDASISTHDEAAKKLVRLALASEVSRQPLRRADITAKVLGPNSRSFKAVFATAQSLLLSTFGMTLTELPAREKITVAQKRAAQRSAAAASQAASAGGGGGGGSGTVSASTASNAYILTSALPDRFRVPAILAPPKLPSAAAEASYAGLYGFVVGVICLSQGHRVSENRLESILKKCNSDNYALGDKTERVLKRMEKDGYIVKVREREAGGEETVDWVVGPRGKVEVGENGVAGLVRTVYGKKDVEVEELEERLEKSLGKGTFRRKRKRVEEHARVDETGDAGEMEEQQEEEALEAEDI